MYQETREAITPLPAQRNRPDAPQMCFYIAITNIESNDFILIRLELDITDKSLRPTAQFPHHSLYVTCCIGYKRVGALTFSSEHAKIFALS